MCNMCVMYGVYVVRVCVGTSSLDEAECNSSKPRDVYHLNAVNLRPSANPLASRAKRSNSSSRPKSHVQRVHLCIKSPQTQDLSTS